MKSLLAKINSGPLYPRIYRRLRKLHRSMLRRSETKWRSTVAKRIEVAGGATQQRLLADLSAALEAAGVGFTTGGLTSELRPRIHLSERQAELAIAVIAETAGRIGQVSFKEYQLPVRPIDEFVAAFELRDFRKVDLWILERRTGGTDHEPAGGFSILEIDFWHHSDSAFRAQYAVAARPNDVATSMRWDALDRVLGLDGSPRQPTLGAGEQAPDLFGCDFDIDVVYTWVDDQDPHWQSIKDSHSPRRATTHEDTTAASAAAEAENESRAHHAERFRNRDELRYSLRSLEMFAPFVRKIFIVTMDQTPEWLNTDHPQIEVVSHRDIYAHADALPTFNSSSIETQLHHIDGLAEHFIYFNDDVFLGQLCTWADFYLGNGASRFFPAVHSIAASVIDDSAEEYLVADKNAIRLFAERFGYVVHRPMAHVPHATRRSVLYELEETFAAEFEACERERFRSRRDLRPIAFMGHHFGFATGRAVPSSISQRYLALWKPVIGGQLAGVLNTRRYKTFCINDVGVQPDRADEVDGLVQEFLDGYFPYPSSYERSGSESFSNSDGSGK